MKYLPTPFAVSPALLGFRTSDPAVVSHVDPVSPVLVGFRPLAPRAERDAPKEVSSSSRAREDEHPAEYFARKLGDVPTAEDICQLLDLLPGEKPARCAGRQRKVVDSRSVQPW